MLYRKTATLFATASLLGALLTQTASAALLGVAPLGLPNTAYNNGGSTTYDASQDTFAVIAQPTITVFPGPPIFASVVGTPKSVRINIVIDASGQLVGSTNRDLVLVGNVDTNDDGIPDANGELLTGRIVAYGSSNGNTDNFDFRFRATGGLLSSFYAGQDIGVELTVENSSFDGSFAVNFAGGAKGSIGPIPAAPNPAINIEKFTNGHDGDGANGAPTVTPPDGPFAPGAAAVAQVTATDTVVWTYRVTNTGTEDLIDITVTDPSATTQGATIVCPNTGDDTIPFLAALAAPVDCTASLPGGARELAPGDLDVVPGCGDGRPTYVNTGEVAGKGKTSGEQVTDMDDSHYCNPVGDVNLEKFTNGHDGDGANGTPALTPPDGPFAPGAAAVAQVTAGDPVVWTYRVSNTGPSGLVDLVVTDAEAAAQGADIICPGTGNNTIPSLAFAATIDCTATLPGGARELASGDSDVVPGCGDGRPTYENTGFVNGFIEFTNAQVEDTDPSHYCNPQEPDVKIIKFTNKLDANDPNGASGNPATEVPRVAPGATVTWTYEVTNTGNTAVLFDDVVVTDNQPGVGVVLTFDRVLTENGDANVFDPNDVWLYTATLPAENLENPSPGVIVVEDSCTADGTIPPSTAYTNIGTVTIPGASDEDPSSYCNPLTPAIELEKYTNGHDGDNANGVPTTTPPDGPFTANAIPDAVAQVAIGDPVVWTYQVRNAGTENLVDISVTDLEAAAQGAAIECPGTANNTIAFLGIGATVDCTATLLGGAVDLQFGSPDVVQGCGDARPTYMNTGDVVGTGETSGEQVTDMDDSHYCNPPPVCEIEVAKTCIVAPPPPSDNLLCESAISATTLRYTGPSMSGATVVFTGTNDGSATYDNVNLVSGVTVLTAPTQNGFTIDAGDGNGLGSKTTITINGVEEIIHTSCSAIYAADAPAPLDGNTPNPPNSEKGDPSPNWFVVNFRDKDDAFVEAPDTTPPTGAESCVVTPREASCDTLGKPTSLTLRYTGGGCPGSNTQGSKSDCSGSVNGGADVNISVDAGDGYTVTPTSVAPGGLFTVTRGGDDFKSNTVITLSNNGGSQVNDVHTSCSAPLKVGDEFGGMTLVSFNGDSGGTEVTYRYLVSNTGNSDVSLSSVFDDKLGELLSTSPQPLPQGGTLELFSMANITEDTTNVVDVQGNVAGVLGAQCVAADAVTVSVPPPPPAPVSCSDIKDITSLRLVWNGSEVVDVVSETGQTFTGVVAGDVLLLDTPKDQTGNDVDVFITGNNESGQSTFHISCSDDQMNGTEDCGLPQGDGKDDNGSLLNLFLLDGMTGENGEFVCNIPQATGNVLPGSTPPSTGNVVPESPTLDLGDDKKVKWELTNTGTADVFITRVTVTKWPAGHAMLKKFKLDGDFAKDVNDTSAPTVVPDDKAFESDPNKRRIEAGKTERFEIEFDEDVKGHVQSDYEFTIEFDNGQVLTSP